MFLYIKIGIGKETALDLAKRGASVILACRDLSKAIEAADFIRKQTGNGNVFVEILDLASLESVRQFSKKINKQEERIDILAINAGIMAWKNIFHYHRYKLTGTFLHYKYIFVFSKCKLLIEIKLKK